MLMLQSPGILNYKQFIMKSTQILIIFITVSSQHKRISQLVYLGPKTFITPRTFEILIF